MTNVERSIKALEMFKDWSNYLLVTTIAAIGWVSTTGSITSPVARPICIWAFGLSAVLGVFTLAVIPRIAESITDETTSIYDCKPQFNLLWFLPPQITVPLKLVCWPQHFLFVVGIIAYVLGTYVTKSHNP